MRRQTAQLKRLQRELDRQQRQAQDDAQRIREIHVYCEGELMEVLPVGAKVIAVVNVDVGRL